MSQTTRCPSCSTLFKVVADQLRISDGWVRCGHCKQVFDASKYLQAVAAEPLLPDLLLDQLRAPPQPVVRTPSPQRNWGDERIDISPRPVQAPLSAGPAAVPPHDLGQRALDERVLHVPEPGVPAFLAAPDYFEREATAVDAQPADAPSYAWTSVPSSAPVPLRAPATAAADEQPVLLEADTSHVVFTPEEAEKRTGYELPAAVLPESDLEWLESVAKSESEVVAEWAVEAETDHAQALGRPWDADADAGKHDTPSAWSVGDETGGASNTASTNTHPVEESGFLDSQRLEDADSDAAPEPSFVRSARRQALWRKPAVRAVLGLLAVLLTAALLLQVALQQRNYLAAAWPQWRPHLETMCAPLQCRVDAYRDISSVVVDSSSFSKLRGNDYQFVITLKNRSGMELEMPAVELTLTDTGNQPVLRRVFTLADLSAPATLAARGEWAATLQMQLAPSDSALTAGYRVLAFYP